MDEREACRLIEQVCLDHGRRPPRDIVFRVSANAYVTHGRDGRIVLPRQSFVELHQIAESEEELRLLVLHEVAHYLSGNGTGHKPPFYLLLFSLCEQYGVDLGFALADETDYKPRYAAAGWRLFQATKSPLPPSLDGRGEGAGGTP